MNSHNQNISISRDRRQKLSIEKPAVYEKVMMQDELINSGRAGGVIVLNYEYICNFECNHCSSDGLMIKTKEDMVISKKRRHLTPKVVRSIFDEAHRLGFYAVAISGGEPLAYKDYDEVIHAIGPDRFWIATDTNGWLLNQRKAEHLKSIGVNKVQISLDSYFEAEHDSHRNKVGSYKRVMKAVESAKAAGLEVLILTCVTRDRVYSDELLEMIAWTKKEEIGLYVTLAKPIGPWAGRIDAMCGDEEIKHLEYLARQHSIAGRWLKSNNADIGCIAMKRSITITKYGHVMPCPYIQVSIGNLFDEPLENILRRGLSIKHFSYGESRTCISGNRDHEFVKLIMPKIWGSKEPIHYTSVFGDNDFVGVTESNTSLKNKYPHFNIIPR
jgi:MoaA/NifB/PqqE/SkfB family radical SAM enzyme